MGISNNRELLFSNINLIKRRDMFATFENNLFSKIFYQFEFHLLQQAYCGREISIAKQLEE